MLTLAAAGHVVQAVARTEADLLDLAALHPDLIVPRAVDGTDTSAFDAIQVEHALVYQPAVSAQCWRALRGRVPGSSVQIATSAAAGPGAPPLVPLPLPWHRLLLGWTSGPHSRWHTPEEISAAALDVLRAEEDRLLGAVRPWDERPAR